jgi:hypothetical protein
MSKSKRRQEGAGCPVGSFFNSLEEIFDAGPDIGGHLKRSRLELLKAVRAWADGQIERLEKGHPSTRKKKATKIEVD